ncbi:hypothetical protein Tco_0017080 [Tanacetum coccineum]
MERFTSLQVVLDALKLTSFYKAFKITADVPEIYMQEFWATAFRHHSSLRFKMNGKTHTVNVYSFRDMLQICPKLPGQKFKDPLFEEEILSFIRDLRHTGEIKVLSDVNVNHMHQPWRSFAAIINKCLSGKTTALENLVYQVENKNSKKNNDIYYPRFTKVIVDYFMAKDQAIPRRNKMFWHSDRDDSMFTKIRSKAYKTYHAYATSEKIPKPKYIKNKADPESSPKKKFAQASKGKRLKTSAKVNKPAKKKQPATTLKAKGLNVLSEVALSETEQIKLATKRNKKDFHSSHASGSGDGVDIQSKVPNEQQQNISGTNEGAGDEPEVLDVPEYKSESEEESWTFSQGDDDDDNDEDDLEEDNDDEDDDHENDRRRKANDDDEVSSDQRVSTSPDYELTEEEEDQEGNDNAMGGEEEEEELYGDLNLNLERRDVEMTNAQTNQDTEDTHVTLTAEPPLMQQQSSSVSSDLVSKFINPSLDTGIKSILNPNIQSYIPINVSVSIATRTPSFETIIPYPPTPIIQPQQQTPTSTTITTNPTTTLPEILNFASLFGFERRVSALETEMSEFKKTNQFAEVVSSIPGIVDNYLSSKLKDAVEVDVQLQSNKLRDESQVENQEFINTVDSNMKSIIKEQVKAQVSKIMPKIEKYVTESLGVEVLVRSTNQPQTSYVVAASLSEFELKKILIDKIEENKSIDKLDVQKNLYNALVESYNSDKVIFTSYGDVVTLKRGRDDQDKDEDPSTGSNRGTKRRRSGKEESSIEATPKESKSTSSSKEHSHQEFTTGNDDVSPAREVQDLDERQWNPSDSQTPDRKWHKTKTVDDRPPQTWMTQLAQALGTQSSFNDKPLPLIPNARGHQVIPFDHFINNDLEYLKGGSLSQRYTTLITKTKAIDYGHVKWIEDKFYGYAANMETSKDVYSRHRIIAVTSLKIMKYFGYTHLQEIIVRRQDDQLYKFREGKLTNLNLDERFALNVALRMYTRRIVIQERVEDLQLAVESYQKKINLSRPYLYLSDLRNMTPYIAYPNIQGIIYQDDMDRHCFMRTDELHKFIDGILNHLHTALNDITTRIQMEYMPRRKWSKQDKQRARVMIKAIDKKLRDRRLMRSLEKFVGGRPYGGDLRLLERTV